MLLALTSRIGMTNFVWPWGVGINWVLLMWGAGAGTACGWFVCLPNYSCFCQEVQLCSAEVHSHLSSPFLVVGWEDLRLPGNSFFFWQCPSSRIGVSVWRSPWGGGLRGSLDLVKGPFVLASLITLALLLVPGVLVPQRPVPGVASFALSAGVTWPHRGVGTICLVIFRSFLLVCKLLRRVWMVSFFQPLQASCGASRS